jgi:hypothetical protein
MSAGNLIGQHIQETIFEYDNNELTCSKTQYTLESLTIDKTNYKLSKNFKNYDDMKKYIEILFKNTYNIIQYIKDYCYDTIPDISQIRTEARADNHVYLLLELSQFSNFTLDQIISTINNMKYLDKKVLSEIASTKYKFVPSGQSRIHIELDLILESRM